MHFEPSGGAPTDAIGSPDADATAAPLFVQSAHGASVSPVQVALQPTRAGSLLVAGVTNEATAGDDVSSMVDSAGDVFTSVNLRAIVSCGGSVEIWSVNSVHAGVTSVSVTMSSAIPVTAWVIEIADVAPTAHAVSGTEASVQPTTTLVALPQVATPADSLVFSIAQICNDQPIGVHFGTPFTGLAPSQYSEPAYYIATTAGSYGAELDTLGGIWCGSTAAFH